MNRRTAKVLLAARPAVAPRPQPAAEQQAVDGHAGGAELSHTFQIGQVRAEVRPLGRQQREIIDLPCR